MLCFWYCLCSNERFVLAGATAAPQAVLDSVSEAQAATEAQTATEAAAEVQSGEDAINAVLTGAVAKVVYKSAIDAVPDSIDFLQGFLEILSKFKFEGVNSLQQTILDSIQRDFGDTEEAWDLKARAASSDQASTSEVAASSCPMVRDAIHVALSLCLLLLCYFMHMVDSLLHRAACKLTATLGLRLACVRADAVS